MNKYESSNAIQGGNAISQLINESISQGGPSPQELKVKRKVKEGKKFNDEIDLEVTKLIKVIEQIK